MSGRLRLALALEEAAGVQVLRLVAASEHEICAVLTSPPRGETRGSTPFHVATTLALPVLDAALVKDPALAVRLRDEGADLLINVHSLHLLHSAVVQAPRHGCFNLHPGPLPHYAGLNAPSWAIWNGAAEYGVTLHRIGTGIDTGDVAYESCWPLAGDETGLTLSSRCVREGVPLVRKLLDQAATDPHGVPRRVQDLTQRRLYRRGDRPGNGRLSFAWVADEAERLVRAASFHPLASPWGVPELDWGGESIGVLRATVRNDSSDRAGTLRRLQDGRLAVAFARGWLVPELVVRGGRVHSGAELG